MAQKARNEEENLCRNENSTHEERCAEQTHDVMENGMVGPD